MTISICIPQYNRIEYLLKALEIISTQSYEAIEINISDDCSVDETKQKIADLQKSYRFPINYSRFDKNVGYDRNLRKSLEMATGEYCLILGNDDTLFGDSAISDLVHFLEANGKPEVGFINNRDYVNENKISERSKETKVIGKGPFVALKYYSSFSFVAGIVFKKSAFDAVNTSKFDKSIYVQIFLGAKIIADGGSLFTYADAIILKDIRIDDKIANSYRDFIPKKVSEYKRLDGGLPSYCSVAHSAISESKDIGANLAAFLILKRVFLFTYPFWLIDYKRYSPFIASFGLMKGLKPSKFKIYEKLNNTQKMKIQMYYFISSFGGIIMPVFLFDALYKMLYKIAKK